MKKGLTILASLMMAGLVLTGCGSRSVHSHKSSHPKTTAVKKISRPTTSKKRSKKPKVNKKDINKAGLSDRDIKKDSRAVHQKKSTQPVD